MFYRTRRMVTPYDVAAGQSGALPTRPAAALLGAAVRIRLFSNLGLTITPNVTFATFTEATFSGYAASTPTWVGPVNQPPANALIHAQGDFAADAGIGAGEVCWGYYLTDEPATMWFLAETFTDPTTGLPISMAFANPGDFLSIDALFVSSYILQLPF